MSFIPLLDSTIIESGPQLEPENYSYQLTVSNFPRAP